MMALGIAVLIVSIVTIINALDIVRIIKLNMLQDEINETFDKRLNYQADAIKDILDYIIEEEKRKKWHLKKQCTIRAEN